VRGSAHSTLTRVASQRDEGLLVLAPFGANPYACQTFFLRQSKVATTDGPTDSSLSSDDSQISISGRGALGRPGSCSSMATQRQPT
jgi:hypothetical protein